ncbi:uncharacterized protein [Watersipora subatra]|uniref:uncharacterized protein n=1 Tax=Watersipora subatra TaxID=2589382 RepID=UPI00355BEF1A
MEPMTAGYLQSLSWERHYLGSIRPRCPETEIGRLSGKGCYKDRISDPACQHGADHDAGKKLKLKSAILHTNGNHWLACTNIGSSTFVRLFDSHVFDLDDQALKEIASLHRP